MAITEFRSKTYVAFIQICITNKNYNYPGERISSSCQRFIAGISVKNMMK